MPGGLLVDATAPTAEVQVLKSGQDREPSPEPLSPVQQPKSPNAGGPGRQDPAGRAQPKPGSATAIDSRSIASRTLRPLAAVPGTP